MLTFAEQARLEDAIEHVRQAVAQLPPCDSSEEILYRALQTLHTTALAPWCELCDILQSNITPVSRTERSRSDAINLEELFAEDTNG